MVGYIDEFNVSVDGNDQPIRFQSWLKLCVEAHRLWLEARASATAAG
jgi:hypothetical protein